MKCLCCGKAINQNASESEKKWQWHKKCVVNFFHTKEMPVLDITKEQLEFLVNETVNEGLTDTDSATCTYKNEWRVCIYYKTD